MTPEAAIEALWRVASNAVLVASYDRPAQGLTYSDFAVIERARVTLVETVDQWRAAITREVDDAIGS